MGDADPGTRGEETGRFGGYVTGKIIGGGGMGTVYEARHPTLGKRVALKVVKGSLAGDPIAHERFLREAQAVARISHPHVVDVFDLGIEGERAFIVMELLEGETLEALLARKGRLGVTQAVDLLLPVISAAAAIHETDVVHRDLKPANIMLARRGRFAVEPVVLDFGISRGGEATSGEALTEPHLLVGTLPYLSPEQLRDARAGGPQSDQYALGVMLYECLTGRKPFASTDRYELMHAVMNASVVAPSDIAPDIPSEIDRAVLRAMARRPDARFPSIRAFGSALLSVADRAAWKRWASEFAGVDPNAGDAASTETVDDVRRPVATTPRPRRRSLRWLAAAAGALALAALVIVFSRGSSPPTPTVAPLPVPSAPVAKAEVMQPPSSPPAVVPAPASPATEIATETTPVLVKKRAATSRRHTPAPTAASAGIGTLYVNASPDWATITMDGKPAGTTPIVLASVPAGSHTLEARALDREPTIRRSVVVESGNKTRVDLDFGKAGR